NRLREVNEDRNQIIHGYWALSNDLGVASYAAKNPAKSRLTPSDITRVADAVAVATRELNKANFLLGGIDLSSNGQIYLYVFIGNRPGTFRVILPAKAPN